MDTNMAVVTERQTDVTQREKPMLPCDPNEPGFADSLTRCLAAARETTMRAFGRKPENAENRFSVSPLGERKLDEKGMPVRQYLVAFSKPGEFTTLRWTLNVSAHQNARDRSASVYRDGRFVPVGSFTHMAALAEKLVLKIPESTALPPVRKDPPEKPRKPRKNTAKAGAPPVEVKVMKTGGRPAKATAKKKPPKR